MPETASRVRGRIEVVIDGQKREAFASAKMRRAGAATLPTCFQNLRRSTVEHHAAFPFFELPAFMSDLRLSTGLTARALEFVILTAARRSEALGARWKSST